MGSELEFLDDLVDGFSEVGFFFFCEFFVVFAVVGFGEEISLGVKAPDFGAAAVTDERFMAETWIKSCNDVVCDSF